jgi:predicted site-specific integrase-resolvase
MEDNKITLADAAKILGISVPGAHGHLVRGNLKSLGRFGGVWILDRQQVENFKRERERR